MSDAIFVGGGGEGYSAPQNLLLKYGNRHGLIAGATGTGKTVTLQILAEGFSAAGVPVFMADVKGDLAGPALDDQVEALRALAEAVPEMDLSRVGITGWSFGGYLAALAVLDRPDVFHAAEAQAAGGTAFVAQVLDRIGTLEVARGHVDHAEYTGGGQQHGQRRL